MQKINAKDTLPHRPKPKANPKPNPKANPPAKATVKPPVIQQVKLNLEAYDKYNKLAQDINPRHGIGTKENKDLIAKMKKNNVAINISSLKGDLVSTKSEVFQNMGNELILLQEAMKNTPLRFNAANVMLYLAKDSVNLDDNFFHTARWLHSEKCTYSQATKNLVQQLLGACKNEYVSGEKALKTESRDEITRRRYTSGLARLVETKMAKACLAGNKDCINDTHQQLARAMRAQYNPHYYTSCINKWLTVKPEEFPVGRLQHTLQRVGFDAPMRSASAMKRLDPESQKFDVAQFMSFHRFLITEIPPELKTLRDWVFSEKIMPLRGNQPRFPPEADKINHHKIGITLRNISTESLPAYTDKHTRPLDYKAPQKDLPLQMMQIDKGHPLACGLSGTTNMHLWGMYHAHIQMTEAYGAGMSPWIPLNADQIRGFLHILSCTLCLDGGHSRFEVLKAARLVYEAMLELPLNGKYDGFMHELGEVVRPLRDKTGDIYQDFLRPAMQSGYLSEAQMHNAFVDSIGHLRNGREVANKDQFNLRHNHRT